MRKPRSLLSSLSRVNSIEKSIIENGGEITDAMDQALSFTQDKLKGKVDTYAYIIEALKERARHWEEKSALFKKYGKTCLNVVERMRGDLKNHMMMEAIPEIKGDEIRFTIQSSTTSIHVDESQLPPEFWKEEIIRTPDKAKIKAAIKAGHDVPGAMEIPSIALRIFPNHEKKITKNGKKELTHE